MSATFYAGTGKKLTAEQEKTFAAFQVFLRTASVVGPEVGARAVMGGLLSAYVHICHAHGQHDSAIACLEEALHSLKNPEQISFTVEGRA